MIVHDEEPRPAARCAMNCSIFDERFIFLDLFNQTDPCVAGCDGRKSGRKPFKGSIKSLSPEPRLESREADFDKNTVDKTKIQRYEGRVDETNHCSSTFHEASITSSTDRAEIAGSMATKENGGVVQSREADRVCTGASTHGDIESIQGDIQKDNNQASAGDFDSIAQLAKREFKLQLMIKSRELFPKQAVGFPVASHNNQGELSIRQGILKKG